MASKQTYKYIISNSILGQQPDEYSLTVQEYYRIYSFFVTYSICGNQSAKKRTFSDYGWQDEKIKNSPLGEALYGVINLNRNNNFIFTEKDDLREKFETCNLLDGEITNLDIERGVIGKTSETCKHLKLFYRIRNAFAHGKFKLRLSDTNERIIVIQDDNGNNVTARIVLKLSSILSFIDATDINGLIR